MQSCVMVTYFCINKFSDNISRFVWQVPVPGEQYRLFSQILIKYYIQFIWAISIIFNICWNWVQMLIICPVFRIAQNGKKGMVGHSRKLENSKFQTISSLSLKVMGTQISKNSKKGLKFTRVFSYFITFLLLVLNFRCPLI